MVQSELSELRDVSFAAGYFATPAGEIISGPKKTRRGFRKLTPSLLPCGYLQVGLTIGGKSKSVKLHKMVADAFHGPRPSGLVIDHIDGNTTNNAPENLRYVTPRENVVRGRSCLQRDTNSDFVGVTKGGDKWRAMKSVEGRSYYLGLYNTEEEASEAYSSCHSARDALEILPPRDLSSKTVGVSLHRSSGKWRANIGKKHLGWYDTESEAIEARLKSLR